MIYDIARHADDDTDLLCAIAELLDFTHRIDGGSPAQPSRLGDAPLSNSVTYIDLEGVEHTSTWPKVFAAAERIRKYFNAVNVRFVGRTEVLDRLMFAFVLREHVLITGTHGTAKSALTDTVFGNIEGAGDWGMDLTRFTTETHLFGAYDVREMEQTGRLVHMTEGSLAEANFAKLGEFFDADDALLRTTLGVLNERRVARGPQRITFPLVTCSADTNFSVADIPHRGKALAAVLDRFLFHVRVSNVMEQRGRMAMLDMSLDHVDREPLPPLSLSDIVLVSGVIKSMNLVTDLYVKEAYQAMTYAYCVARVKKKGGIDVGGREYSDLTEAEQAVVDEHWVSDRRFIKAAQIMEANAILRGKRAATFEDLAAANLVLCMDRDDHAMLDEARNAMIEVWVAKAQRRDIERELEALAEFTNKVPNTANLDKMKVSEVRRMQQQIDDLYGEVDKFQPETIEARQAQTKALDSLLRTKSLTDARLIDLLIESLPEVEGEPQTLKQRFDQAKAVYDALREMRPQATVTIDKLTAARSVANQRQVDLELAFHGRQHRTAGVR